LQGSMRPSLPVHLISNTTVPARRCPSRPFRSKRVNRRGLNARYIAGGGCGAYQRRTVESIRSTPRSMCGHSVQFTSIRKAVSCRPLDPPVQVQAVRATYRKGEGFIRATSCGLRGRSNLHFRVARQRHLVVDQ
jgi:hypothetical protein